MDTALMLIMVFAIFVWIKFVMMRKPRSREHSILINNDQIKITIRYDENHSPSLNIPKTGKFSPLGSSLEPIELSFSLGKLPQLKTTAPGGPYGMEKDKYQLDLEQAQCSCKGWQLRKHYPIGDSRRLCRHLVNAYRMRELIKGNDEWAEAIIENGEGVPLTAWRVKLNTAPEALITQGDSEEWLNVFAHIMKTGEKIAEASGPISRFGWSIVEKRWAYGVSIPGARELNKILRASVAN